MGGGSVLALGEEDMKESGSSLADTVTNEPNSESDVAIGGGLRWATGGAFIAAFPSGVGDARGVAGENRVANLSNAASSPQAPPCELVGATEAMVSCGGLLISSRLELLWDLSA